MPVIHYEGHGGDRHSVEASVGDSIMRTAINNGVPGIMADCGGLLQCATCHVYVDPAWVASIPAPTEDELALIEGALEVQENSRLSCQIEVTDELDGIVIRIPAEQT